MSPNVVAKLLVATVLTVAGTDLGKKALTQIKDKKKINK